jgi:DnaK suppressor protein
MDVEKYKQRLRDLERQLSARTEREQKDARAAALDSPGDAGDASVADEEASEEFTAAELDESVLQQVRAAMRRIDEGTFGRCVVDDEPIEEKRLEAVPWTRYCAKHQRLREAASRARTPSL